MKIYLIRHGKTQWNLEQRMQGQKDSPLTEEGLNQLNLLGERLKDSEIHGLYASPLKRASDSARRVFPGIEPVLREELKEIALGDWEGCHYEQVKKHPLQNHEDFWGKPHLFQPRPGGGEDIFSVQSRAVGLLNQLVDNHSSEDVIALVSHTVVIKAVLGHISGKSMEQFWDPPFVYPASLSQLDFSDQGVWSISLYGDIAHYEKQFPQGGKL